MTESKSPRLGVWVVFAVALVFSSLLVVRLLAENGWDPTLFIGFGEGLPETTQYAEAQLGRDVLIRPSGGHDGKFFFTQANDPWLVTPEEGMSTIERPTYRAQRMLYPVLAGGGGLFPAGTIIWTLLAVNIVAMGLGAWAVAEISLDLGGSKWWGLAFALNPGFISELLIDGAGVVAGAAGFWAVLLLMRRHLVSGMVLLAASALSREAMLIVALGAGAWALWRGERKAAYGIVGFPAAVVLLWVVYARLRIDFGSGLGEIREIGWPFVGFVQSFGEGSPGLVDVAARLAVILLFVLFIKKAITNRGDLLGWAFVGFIPLGVMFTSRVWLSSFDIMRAIAPMITAFFLLVFLTDRTVQDQARRPGRQEADDDVAESSS